MELGVGYAVISGKLCTRAVAEDGHLGCGAGEVDGLAVGLSAREGHGIELQPVQHVGEAAVSHVEGLATVRERVFVGGDGDLVGADKADGEPWIIGPRRAFAGDREGIERLGGIKGQMHMRRVGFVGEGADVSHGGLPRGGGGGEGEEGDEGEGAHEGEGRMGRRGVSIWVRSQKHDALHHAEPDLPHGRARSLPP